MKHRRCLVFCLAAALLLVACDDASTSAPELQAETVEAHEVVYGKIRSAYGNEITVALLDYEEPTFSPGGSGDAAGGGNTAPDMDGEETIVQERGSARGDASGISPGATGTGSTPSTGIPSGDFTGAPGGEGPPGDRQGGSGRPGGMGSMGGGMQGGAQPTANYQLTGEDATYIIPVTATITTGSGENTQTVRFTQLSYKNVVKLSLDEQGNVVAVDVLE